MPNLDRNSFIDLLERLGSEDNDDVLAAARQLTERVKHVGLTWNDLLVAPPTAAHLDIDDDEGLAEAELADDEDAGRGPFLPEPVLAPIDQGDTSQDLALIDRLLTGYEMSAETIRELTDFKTDIAAGEFTQADRKYLAVLQARLEGRR